MGKIVILGGGDSAEREVSLVTSQAIKSNLEQRDIVATMLDPAEHDGWIMLLNHLQQLEPEMIFIGLHGASGEDGRLQGMLEMCGLPFTGSGSHASALAMDKNSALCLAADCGIPVAARILLHKSDKIDYRQIIDQTGVPLVIKPNSSGSSVGIHIVRRHDELKSALDDAWQYEDWILCEKFIPGRELTITILDGEALPVVEIKPHNGWYDFSNKYTQGNTEYICPAVLDRAEVEKLQKYAEEIFHKLGCSIYGRVDFRYDGETFYFLEANTLPGITPLSLTPMAAKATGMELPDLLLKIIELSKNK